MYTANNLISSRIAIAQVGLPRGAGSYEDGFSDAIGIRSLVDLRRLGRRWRGVGLHKADLLDIIDI